MHWLQNVNFRNNFELWPFSHLFGRKGGKGGGGGGCSYLGIFF